MEHMGLILGMLLSCLVVVMAAACFRARRERRTMERRRMVHLPFAMAVVGMVGGAVFCGFLLYFRTEGVAWTVFGLFALLSLSLMMAYRNCVITYDGSGFQARNFWGTERRCAWREIEKVRMNSDCWIRFQGHWLLVDQLCLGKERFLGVMTEGYLRTTGKPLPTGETSRSGRTDPMRGNLRHPWCYLVMWVFLCGSLGLGSVWCVVYTLTMPQSPEPETLTMLTVTFADSKFSDHDLRLFVPGQEKPYRIDDYDFYDDRLPTPETLRDSQDWHIGVTRTDREIKYLESSTGQVFLTPELVHQMERARLQILLPLVVVMGLFFGVSLYFGIAVARHPERYKPWLRRLYYKDEAFTWEARKHLPK